MHQNFPFVWKSVAMSYIELKQDDSFLLCFYIKGTLICEAINVTIRVS